MQLIKYEKNFLYKIIHKIKSFFRKSEKFVENENKNIVEQLKKEIDYDTIVGCKKYIPTKETTNLVSAFENNHDMIKKLTNEQIKKLIEYYQEKNKELDREFEYKKKKFDNLAKKLNDFCDNVRQKK